MSLKRDLISNFPTNLTVTRSKNLEDIPDELLSIDSSKELPARIDFHPLHEHSLTLRVRSLPDITCCYYCDHRISDDRSRTFLRKLTDANGGSQTFLYKLTDADGGSQTFFHKLTDADVSQNFLRELTGAGGRSQTIFHELIDADVSQNFSHKQTDAYISQSVSHNLKYVSQTFLRELTDTDKLHTYGCELCKDFYMHVTCAMIPIPTLAVDAATAPLDRKSVV